MAISFVGGAVASQSSNATYSISLTALTGGSNSAPSTGDLVILVNSCTSANVQRTVGTSSAGWTDLGPWYQAGSSFATTLTVVWKIMGGTPDTSATMFGPGVAGGYGSVTTAYVLRGVDTSTQPDVTITEASGSGTGVPNPPSCTPITTGAWVVAIGGSAGSEASGTVPSGYSNGKITNSPGTFIQAQGVASKAWSGSGSEDPGTFGGFNTAATISWIGCTFVARPAPSTIIINETVPDVTLAGATEYLSSLWVLPSQVQSGVTYTDGTNTWTGTLTSGGSGMPRSRITNA